MNKEVTFSRAETCLIIEPGHSNPFGNAHGGELIKIMDNTAGIAAAKHAKGHVVTARVDEIVFHNAIHIGDIVTCIAELCYVGRSSMQIMVRIVVHELDNYHEPETALTAFFTMVHMIEGVPTAVPKIEPITDADHELFKLGEQKYQEIQAKYKSKVN